MSKLIFYAIWLLLFLSPVIANSDSLINHPDGIVDQPNGYIRGGFSSIYTVPYDIINDKSYLGTGIVFPVENHLTINSDLTLVKGDTLFYKYSFGVKIYLINPTGAGSRCNPDGAIGAPIVNLSYTGTMPDIDLGQHNFYASLSGLMPLSKNLTLGLGGKYYQEGTDFRVDKLFGILNFYPRAYPAGKEYENPDGVEGIPSFCLQGGGSVNGFYGRAEMKFPINPGITLVFIAHGERTPVPYLRNATIGVRLNLYPGNK